MSNIKNDFKNSKEKVTGKIKEVVGKSTGNEETELKGRLQSQKADLNEKSDDFKEKIAKKINDALDKNEDKKEN